MYTLLISILLSLNIIGSEQEFYDFSPNQQEEFLVVIEDIQL